MADCSVFFDSMASVGSDDHDASSIPSPSLLGFVHDHSFYAAAAPDCTTVKPTLPEPDAQQYFDHQDIEGMSVVVIPEVTFECNDAVDLTTIETRKRKTSEELVQTLLQKKYRKLDEILFFNWVETLSLVCDGCIERMKTLFREWQMTGQYSETMEQDDLRSVFVDWYIANPDSNGCATDSQDVNYDSDETVICINSDNEND